MFDLLLHTCTFDLYVPYILILKIVIVPSFFYHSVNSKIALGQNKEEAKIIRLRQKTSKKTCWNCSSQSDSLNKQIDKFRLRLYENKSG